LQRDVSSLKVPFTYYPVKALLYLWSLLPMPILHLQSTILAWLMHRVVGYRRAVVMDNLRQSFPDKSEREIQGIAKGFYLNLTDVIMESLKLMSMSAANLRRRVRHTNPEVVGEMVAHGGGGIAIFGHFANWEWLGAGMGLQLPFATVGVYKTQSSKLANALMLHIRCRLGNEMITMEQTYRESLTRLQKPCYIAFLGDQVPNPQPKLYFSFLLGRPAAVQLGIATICLKMNVPLYYFDIRRERRGHYAVTLRKVPHEDLLPFSKESCHALTDRHVEMLEQIIRAQPSDWLWSHRRWKRKPQVDSILSKKLP
jgi:KDO2-lipid IV(A) lauroyltransferase